VSEEKEGHLQGNEDVASVRFGEKRTYRLLKSPLRVEIGNSITKGGEPSWLKGVDAVKEIRERGKSV